MSLYPDAHTPTALPIPRHPLSHPCPEEHVIILGVVLLILGYLLPIPVLITIGWIVAGIGLVLLLISAIGQREIGGRRYWY